MGWGGSLSDSEWRSDFKLSPCIPRAPTMDHGGTRKEVVPASHILELCSTLVPTLHRSGHPEKRQRDAAFTLNSSCWQDDLSNV